LLEEKLARLQESRQIANQARVALGTLEHRNLTPKQQEARKQLEEKLAALDVEIAETEEDLKRTGYGDPQAAKLRYAFHGGRNTSTADGEVALRRDQRVADWCASKGMTDQKVPSRDAAESFGRYLRGIATGNWANAVEERALAEGSTTSGGALVPTFLAANVIDLARNATRVIEAGAITVPMASETLKMARLTGEGSPAWRSEGAQINAGDLTFDQVTFAAKNLDRLVLISRELFEDSDPAASGVIAHSFAKQIALELDRAALRGSGTAPEPLGVVNTSGVTQTAHGTNGTAPTDYDWLLDAAGLIRDNNFEPNAHILAPRTLTELQKTKTTYGEYLQPPPSMLPMLTTNQVPTNLDVGTSSTASEIYTAQWDQLAIGMRTSFELLFLRERYIDTGQYAFLAHLRADVQVLHPAAFTVDTGIL
jgi:HK97 family phage major capsid protein